MINVIYRLTAPKMFEEVYSEIDINKDVIVRPTYLSICKADQRYYQGTRSTEVLDSKLPMALIHEGISKIVKDNTGTFEVGDNVVMIPNTPTEDDKIIKANYLPSSKFRGSGFDGYTCDLITLKSDRLIKIPDSFNLMLSSFIELISVTYQAICSFENISISRKNRIGVWGDGAVGYLTALLLTYMYPDSEICVFGKHFENLNMFSFVDNVYKTNKVPDRLTVDHAFECVGSQASQSAINQIIDIINPQGSIMLLGVSEYPVPINTRLVLEKGLTLTGISRSEREDFEGVINLINDNQSIFKYLEKLVADVIDVSSVDDLKSAFDKDSINGFGKTVLKWNK
ncbi:MAG: zinc-binding dehydrogenase [archaeon]|nr:zinc-binding dehydrogenase [archaeon]